MFHTRCNVRVPFLIGVVIVIFAGPEGPSRRLLSIAGGFRADVCKQVYIGGSGDNKHGVVIVKFSGQELKMSLKMA